jgi:putative transposase
MSDLRRHFSPGCVAFLTLVCANRNPWLAPEASKARLLAIVRTLKVQCHFQCHAWVILNDHLHLLVTDPGGDISGWVQKLKLRFTRGHQDRPRRVWQRRFWDHLIRDETDLQRHLDYIHHNPVKHGLVSRTRDYPWSSFAHFVRRGWYPEDWVAVAEDDGAFGDPEAPGVT